MTIEYKDSKRITAVSSDWTGDVTSNITWSTTGKVNYNISGTTITRTGSAGWSLSKIQSEDTFTVGNGKFMIEFSGNANDENSTQLGFNTGTLGYHHGSATPQNKADFAIYMAGGSQVEVYESGTKNYDSGGSRSASDRYRIEIDNDGLVKYYLQAGGTGSFVLKYTSSTTASGTYFIQANSYADTSVATVHSKTVNTAIAKPTDVQDNSILVEKDTARRYWFSEATTPTTTFDYSNTTGWTFTNSAITNTGGECVMTSGDASNDVRGYKSLGTTLSDTVWTADFEFEHSDESPRAAGMPFCITAGTGIPASATQDMLGVKTFTSSNVIFPMYKDGSGSVTTGSTITLTFGTKYYCRLSRTTATNLELKVFSDSSRSTQVGSTINLTIPSTITTLTTLQHAISPGSSGDKMNFKIDNTKICNGTTSVAPATWNMQPTYPYSSTGWTATGGGAVATDNLTLALDADGAQDQVNYDLTSISSDKFVLDFTLNFSRLTIGSNLFWFMGLVNSTNWIATNSTNHMGIFAMQESATKTFACSDGTTTWNGANEDAQSWTPTTGVDYYFRLTKLTSTTYKVELFGNSARTNVTSTSDGTVSSMTDLRYLVFTGDNNSGTGNATFTISDLKFYNGVTSIN